MSGISSSTSNSKVWLITGCSTGLGRALAEAVLAKGDKLIATARNRDSIAELELSYPNQAIALKLDVTQTEEVQQAVANAVKKFGRIDVLVNNAGFGMIGAVEEVSDAETRRVFETNVFGVLNVTRAALPYLREQGSGHILNISSLNGFVANPGTDIYTASKFAVEGFSEAMAAELAPLGIRVTIVEPGPFRTDAAGRSLNISTPIAAYANTPAGHWRQQIANASGRQAGDPVKAAAAMLQVVESENPPLRLPLGNLAVQLIRNKLAAVTQELDTWESIARATDFEQ